MEEKIIIKITKLRNEAEQVSIPRNEIGKQVYGRMMAQFFNDFNVVFAGPYELYLLNGLKMQTIIDEYFNPKVFELQYTD